MSEYVIAKPNVQVLKETILALAQMKCDNDEDCFLCKDQDFCKQWRELTNTIRRSKSWH